MDSTTEGICYTIRHSHAVSLQHALENAVMSPKSCQDARPTLLYTHRLAIGKLRCSSPVV